VACARYKTNESNSGLKMSQVDNTRGAIAPVVAALAKEGGRMTQVAITRAADVSQGWVIGGGSIVGNESSASKDKNIGLKMFFYQSIGAV
jgi:hypothetical protein